MAIYYDIYKDENRIAVALRIPVVTYSGALELRDEWGAPYNALLAAGQWTHVLREERD